MGAIVAKGGLTFGTALDDVIEGSEEIDAIFASFGHDVINGAGSDDLITAGDGNDILDGGVGDDTLDGGKGNDYLLGGPGSDTFLFKPLDAPGQDIIADFNAFEDMLVFDLPGDFSTSGFDASLLDFALVGNDLIITLDQSDLHITLQNPGPLEGPFNVTFI